MIKEGVLDRKAKELIALTVFLVNGCEYCSLAHEGAALMSGSQPRGSKRCQEGGGAIQQLQCHCRFTARTLRYYAAARHLIFECCTAKERLVSMKYRD